VIPFISTFIIEMDRLGEEQRDKLKRTSTDRLRIQLCKTGYDEEKCLTLDRQSLIEAVAVTWLEPQETETVEVAGPDQWQMMKIEMKRQELLLRKQELDQLREESERKDQLRREEMQVWKLESEKKEREMKAENERKEREWKAEREEEKRDGKKK
jgi:hypothetical protein